ncbi:MAG: Sec-independent protein translocase protein TatB [Rhodobacteraceae bacterium]|nr:Sec-independent protein translocase protein TatB [Paracoccaceae bacterium]
MFDIGMSEMAIVGVVALIVVGPKDLPVMFRKVGQFVGKARGMARDFSRAMNEAADEAGVRDVTDTLKQASDLSNKGLKDAAKGLTDYDETPPKPSKLDDAKAAVEAANKAAENWPPADPGVLGADDGVDEASTEVVKEPVEKKTAAKKPAAKKPAAKKAPAKKPTAKKTAAKKPTKTAKAKT